MTFFRRKSAIENLNNGKTPLLDNAGRSNPFDVPGQYFEQFEQQIMQNIRFVKPVSPVERFFRNTVSSLLQPQIAAAASVILIVATSLLIFYNHPEKEIVTSGITSDKPVETIVRVSYDLPEERLYSAEVENRGNQTTITINISPDVKPEHLKKLQTKFTSAIPVFNTIEKQMSQYFAQMEQEKQHFESVTQQTNQYKLSQGTKNTASNSPILNNIYQYHPQYQTNPVTNINTSSLPVNNQNEAINTNTLQSKKPVIIQTSAKLPHFALPETICAEKSTELIPSVVSNQFLYQWSTGERTPTIVVRSSGNYSLTMYDPDNNNEFVTSSTFARIIPKPAKSLPSYATLCSDETLTLEPQIENAELYTYFWIPTNATNKDIIVRNQGLYVLAITGCNTYYDSVLVTKEHCDVMLPNVITPNNDGVNDYFYIQGLENYPGTKLAIYDRSGNMIFSTVDYQNNWSGDKTPSGTYFFILRFYDGIEKHGTLTILK